MTKLIEQVREGDLVASRNQISGKTELRRVVAASRHTVMKLVILSLADAKTGKVVETITTTAEHPFAVKGKGFVVAGQLAIGNAIVTRAGPALVVKSKKVQAQPKGVAVYNFTVDGDHNYFVGTANGGMWVHNADQCLIRVGRWMSEGEHDAMVASGKVQESVTGTSHVAVPADPSAFMKQAKTGSRYVEFDVPVSSVVPTQAGWGKIVGPNSLEGRLAKRKGLPIPQMPDASRIAHTATKVFY